jgi:cyclophilin family peptidyl-prolyl cis-trans isomerase
VFARLVDAFPEEVQVIYRHFPLTSIHANAQKAAEASEAAGTQGAFWAYHDKLFETQSQWAGLDEDAARDFFVSLATELELDVDKFAAELDAGIYTAYVTGSQAEAIRLGITSTPSVILDGDLLPGTPNEYVIWEEYVEFQKIIVDIQYDAPPPMTIDPEATYLATVEMESGDSFVIELYASSAPQIVNNFIFLAQDGWYDGVSFHRVLPGFMAQTGDPTGTGIGGPGYKLPDEFDPDLVHDSAGVVSMANSGPNTNGSQWFVTYEATPHLDGLHTIFGHVIQGMDVVEAITPRDPSRNLDAPEGDRIATITIEKQ